jgi:hypothetical protein
MNLNESVNTLQSLLSNLKPNDAKFAADLIASFKKYGSLTPRQAPWIERLIVRAQTPAPIFSAPLAAAEAPAVVNVGGFDGVVALFNAAKAHLKFPKITLLVAGKQVKLSLLGAKSKFAGAVNITDGGKYPFAIWYGRVSPEGVFSPSAKVEPEFTKALSDLLVEFSKNPARVAKEHGKLTGNCCFCNKVLGLGEDKRSVAVGFGPVCADHYGLKAEWLSGVAKAEAKAELAAAAPLKSIDIESVIASQVVSPEYAAVNTDELQAELGPEYVAEPVEKVCFFCEKSSSDTKEVKGYTVCSGCSKELAGVSA